MRVEPSDRTRIMLAAVVTLLALPVILHANRNNADQRPATVAAAGAPGLGAGQPLSAGGAATDGTATGAAVTTGSSTEAPTTPAPTDPVTSVTEAPTTTAPAHHDEGRATFHQYDDAKWGPSSCAHATAPMGTVLQVRNLDTGQTTSCIVRDRVDPASGFVLDVDTEVFSSLGDPAAGVAPVAITW